MTVQWCGPAWLKPFFQGQDDSIFHRATELSIRQRDIPDDIVKLKYLQNVDLVGCKISETAYRHISSVPSIADDRIYVYLESQRHSIALDFAPAMVPWASYAGNQPSITPGSTLPTLFASQLPPIDLTTRSDFDWNDFDWNDFDWNDFDWNDFDWNDFDWDTGADTIRNATTCTNESPDTTIDGGQRNSSNTLASFVCPKSQ